MATQVGVLYLGRLVEVAQARALFDSPQHPYTRMLLDAVPDLTLSGVRRTPIRGEIPNRFRHRLDVPFILDARWPQLDALR